MKKFRKLLLPFLLLLMIAGAFYAYKEYNRKATILNDTKPAFIVTAPELLTDYENDEAAANKKYLGKIVQVSGYINTISNSGDTVLNISIGDGLHKLSCKMHKSQAAIINQYKPAQLVKIKGVYTGYLMDVEINNCVIVK